MPTPKKRLYRSRTDRKIAGVCGGLSDYMGIDSTVIRLILVVIALITAIIPTVIAYIIIAAITPLEPATPHN